MRIGERGGTNHLNFCVAPLRETGDTLAAEHVTIPCVIRPLAKLARRLGLVVVVALERGHRNSHLELVSVGVPALGPPGSGLL